MVAYHGHSKLLNPSIKMLCKFMVKKLFCRNYSLLSLFMIKDLSVDYLIVLPSIALIQMFFKLKIAFQIHQCLQALLVVLLDCRIRPSCQFLGLISAV